MKIPLSKAVASRVGKQAACLILIIFGVASLSQTARSQTSYADVVMSYGPRGFWQLNETDDPSPGTVPAVDSSVYGRHGTYRSGSQNAYNGILGPQPPVFNGFPPNNGALGCTAGDLNSVVSLPNLNLSSTVVDTTIIMWINPTGIPATDAGLFFDRSGGNSTCGLCFHNYHANVGLTELGYNWNDRSDTWGWDSYLYPPLYTWSFVALVVESNRATIYLYYIDSGTGQPVLLSAGRQGVHSAYDWNGGGQRLIGADPLNNNRVFQGTIDGVAIYNSALTQDQILNLFAAGVGVPGFAPMISAQPQSRYVTPGSKVQMRATVNGTSPLAYQWQLNGTNVNLLPNSTNFVGANSNILTILSATTAEAGTYRLIVTNLYGTAISSNAVLTVQLPRLVGQWFTNDTLADVSGYMPAGTHNAVPIGTGVYEFTNDVPPGKAGKSVLLSDGASGFAIANSSTLDAAPTNTFDERINHSMTVAVWAKGWPGTWNPFVSKYGEAGQGWQIRQFGQDGVNPCWTMRGVGGTVTVGVGGIWAGPDDLASSTFPVGNDPNTWHLYVGTYDAGTGVRRMYVNGQLAAEAVDCGIYNLARASFLCIGARDNGGNNFGNFFTGQIYDVRLYNYALSYNEILGLYGVNPPSFVSQPENAALFEGEKASLSASASGTPPLVYQWQLNGTNINLLPNSTNYVGINSNVLTILSVTPAEAGSYRVVVTNLYGAITSSVAVVSLKEKKLLGRWFAGAPTLADVSGYQPAGTHDGYPVGAGNYTFDNDVPAGFTGQSLWLPSNDTGIAIANSSINDPGYTNTFDETINTHMTVAFWAKGAPGAWSWNPWISKWGEDNPNGGWQLRTGGAPGPVPCWTIRNNHAGGFALGCGPDWNKAGWRDDLHAAVSGAGSTAVYYAVNQTDWYFYVGTFNAVTGERKLYVNGVLRGLVTNQVPYSLARGAHVIIGGRENPATGVIGNHSPFRIYDVRIYNYELTADEILAMMPDPVIYSQPPSAVTAYVGGQITLAATVGITMPITNQWQLNGTNLTDGVFGGAIITGAKSNVLTIANVTPAVQGIYRLIVSNPKGTIIGSNITLTVSATVPPPSGNLVGAWFTGAPTLADTSGYQPAGTHDGYRVGAANYWFTNDVPPGKPAGHQSLVLGGGTAIAITNSSTLDAGYVNTFDETLSAMTVMFWAKGYPGNWNPWVSKFGESGQGWQLRDGGNNANPAWTTRGSGGTVVLGTAVWGNPDDLRGTIATADGEWHHYAGTFDPVTGVRNLYVDGVLRGRVTNCVPYNLATSSHVVIGGRDNGGNNFGNWFTGQIYDVRIYNVALTEAQINSAVVPVVPSFIGQPVLIGDKLILNWTFGTLLQATNVLGPWTPVTATPPYTNIITTAPQMFFRLSNP